MQVRCRTVLSLLVASASLLRAQSTDQVTELERFITREGALDRNGTLMPNSRPVSGLFGEQSNLVDIPRSVTVLTAEALKEYGIRSFADLGKIGAGTQQANYYGIPGTPILRGAKGSVFFNGMQRAYQRNEMPLSFGSAEAIDIVKGPAPAHFGPGMVGGFANLIPKSPFFDQARGSIQLSVGSDDLYQVQADFGGPSLFLGRPAAFRSSVTAQRAASYYDRIRNDYLSVYFSMKSQVARDITLFTGTEYFDYKSNENAGWNRPTAELLASGRYVIGEPLNVTSAAWGGVADRNAINANPALVVSKSIVDAGVNSGFITAAQRATLNDLSSSDGRSAAYGANSAYSGNSNDGYQYTPAYFAAGGKVFTTQISGRQVLSDTSDYAKSQNFLWFLDLASLRVPDLPIKSQFLIDWVHTDKLSTYGYAARCRQLVMEEKISAEQHFAVLQGMTLISGLSARYTDGLLLTDYSVEPFSRRDISRAEVSPNTVILAGPQIGPDGLNYWTPSGTNGANVHSELWQFTAFAQAQNRIGNRLVILSSLLATHAPFTTECPSEVHRATAAQIAALNTRDHKNYANGSISPVLTLVEGLNAYATIQRGTSLDSTPGGAIFGRGNFAENTLDEAGLKAELLNHRVVASVSLFRWKQDQFDLRTTTPELLHGRGIEFEISARATSNLTLTASAGWQRVRRFKPLIYRSMPMTEQQWALYGGVFNSQYGPASKNLAEGAYPSANPDLVFPGSPETQYKLLAQYRLPHGFAVSGGPVVSEAYWHNFDHTLRLPGTIVWNFRASWTAGRWSTGLDIENAFDADYFLGSDPVFAANTLITKAPGLQWRLTLARKF